jgi:F420-0:gamma-glutamyl ligase
MEFSMSEQNEFLQPLLDLMNKNADALSSRLDKVEKKIDDNTSTTNKILSQARYTNGRVTKLEKLNADKTAIKVAKRFNVDPKTVYIVAIGAVIVLAIVATLLHINLGGIGL